MEKASATIRRSSAKLRASFGGSSDLHLLIAQLKSFKSASKHANSAESEAWNDMARWAGRQQNRAVQDVVARIVDLAAKRNEIKSEALDEALKSLRKQFEAVLEGEKILEEARGKVEESKTAVGKMRKKGPEANQGQLEFAAKLSDAESDLREELITYEECRKEVEAAKMIRLKEALIRLTQSYAEEAEKARVLFEAANNIASLIPDVKDMDLADIRYKGGPISAGLVRAALEEVKVNDDNDPLPALQVKSADFPPPYSAEDSLPILCSSFNGLDVDSMNSSVNSNSDLNRSLPPAGPSLEERSAQNGRRRSDIVRPEYKSPSLKF